MKCSVRGCKDMAHCRGWCRAHYQRWLRTGDPLPKRQRPKRWRHGLGGYNNHGCKCDVCTKANADYQREYMGAHPEQREASYWRNRSYRKGGEDMRKDKRGVAGRVEVLALEKLVERYPEQFAQFKQDARRDIDRERLARRAERARAEVTRLEAEIERL